MTTNETPNEPIRYKVVQDNDAHWYLIKVENEHLFKQQLKKKNWEFYSDNFQRIDGPQSITFTYPKKQERIK